MINCGKIHCDMIYYSVSRMPWKLGWRLLSEDSVGWLKAEEYERMVQEYEY